MSATFKDIQFPGSINGNITSIHNWDYVIVSESVRIYYKVNTQVTGTPSGFDFYVTEWVSVRIPNVGDWEDPSTEVDCMFWGNVYWDGLRHLYMGDPATDNDNYLYCADTEEVEGVFKKLRELELKYCDNEYLY